MAALDELWTPQGASDQVALIDTIEDTSGPDPEFSLEQTELNDALAEAIARLPEREKLVVTLYYYEELTLREIGEVLGVTESRVSQLHTKAILRLKAKLQGSLERASLEPVLVDADKTTTQARKALAAAEAAVTAATAVAADITSSGLVLAVEGEGLDAFVSAAATALPEAPAATMLTGGIHAAYEQGVAALARHDAVNEIARGQVGEGVAQGQAAFFETTAARFLADTALGHEVFGASSLLVRCANEDELHAVLRAAEGQLTATIVGKGEIYAHDWGDAERIDRWLYERYGAHHLEMRSTLRIWIAVAADHAALRGVPLVFGEGWVGYTPLEGRFEEGPIGAEYCRLAMRESRRVGARGSIVCSNGAPQHPMWDDVALQRECNAIFAAPA